MSPYIRPGMSDIELIVCLKFKVSPAILKEKTRKGKIPMTRFVIWYFHRKIKNSRLADLALMYRKDHSNVIHGLKQVVNQIETDKNFAQTIQELETLLS